MCIDALCYCCIYPIECNTSSGSVVDLSFLFSLLLILVLFSFAVFTVHVELMTSTSSGAILNFLVVGEV